MKGAVTSENLTNQLFFKTREDEASLSGIIIEDKYESVFSFLKRMIKYANEQVFWLLLTVADDVHTSSLFVMFQLLILCLQNVSYAFYPLVEFPWPNDFVHVFKQISDNVGKFPSSPNGLGEEKVYFSIAAICILQSSLAFAGLTLKYMSFTWPIAVARFFIKLACGIFFLPILSAMFQVLFACIEVSGTRSPHPFITTQKCYDTTHIVLMSISAVLVCAFLFTVTVTSGTIYDTDCNPRSRTASLDAKSTGRTQILRIYVHVFLQLLFAIFHQTASKYVLSWLLIVCGVQMIVVETFYVPYFDDNYQAAVLYSYFLLSWTGLGCFATTLMPKPEGAVVFMYCGLPLLLLASLLLVRSRYFYVESLRDSDLTNPILFELKARLFAKGLRQHMGLYFDDTPIMREQMRITRIDCEHLLQLGIERFPNDARLHLVFTMCFIYIINNKVLAYSELQAVDISDPTWDVAFFIDHYRRLLDAETTASQSKEVRSYLEFKTRKEIADECVRTAAKSIFEFWSELLRAAPNIDTLSVLGHVSRSAMTKAGYNYLKLLEINPNSIPVLRSYGNFVLDLLGDVPKASALFKRSYNVDRIRKKSANLNMQRGNFLQHMESNLDIFDERNAVFAVVCDRRHVGIIESVNQAGVKLMGYAQQSDMVSQNISLIIPRPLSDIHDDIVSNFLNKGISKILNTTRVAFAMHKAGYIFPVNLYIRWADQSAGKMIGVIQPIDMKLDVHLVLDKETMTIQYGTTSCYDYFGITNDSIMNKQVKVWDFLPMLNDKDDIDSTDKCWEQISLRSGLTCVGVNNITGEYFGVQAWILSVQVLEKEVTFVKIHIFDQTADDDTTDASDGGEGVETDDYIDDDDYDEDNTSMTSSGSSVQFIHGGHQPHQPALESSDSDSDGLPVVYEEEGSSVVQNGFVHKARMDRTHSTASITSSKKSYTELLADVRKKKRGKKKKRSSISSNSSSVMHHDDNASSAISTVYSTIRDAVQNRLKQESINMRSYSDIANALMNRKAYNALKKAIAVENDQTVRWLRRLSRFFVVLLIAMTGVAIAVYFVSSSYLTLSKKLLREVAMGVRRGTIAQDVINNIREISLLNVATAGMLYRQSSSGSDTSLSGVHDGLVQRVRQMTLYMRTVSNHVNAMSSFQKLEELNTQPTVDVYILLNGYVKTIQMGFLETLSSVNAMALDSSLTFPLPIATQFQAFAAITNGQNLPPRIALVSRYQQIHLREKNTEAFGINMGLAAAALLIMLFIFLFLVKPIVLHIERGKARVLVMFIDIPKIVRRLLRRRAYAAMKDDSENTEMDGLYDDENDARSTLNSGKHAVNNHAGSINGSISQGDNASVSFHASTLFIEQLDATERHQMFRNARIMQHLQENSIALSVELEAQGKNKQLQRKNDNFQDDLSDSDHNTDIVKNRSSKTNKKNAAFDNKELDKHISRSSVMSLFLKYSLCFVFVFIYFGVTVAYTTVYLRDMEKQANTVHHSIRRTRIMQSAYFFFREHMFNNYAYAMANNPTDPTISKGPFEQRAREYIRTTQGMSFGLLHDGGIYDVQTGPIVPQIYDAYFANACSLPIESEYAPRYYRDGCLSFGSAIMRNGTEYQISNAMENMRILLTENTAGVFAPLVGIPAAPTAVVPGDPLYSKLVSQFSIIANVMTDLAIYPLMLVPSMLLNQSRDYIDDYNTIRVILLICFIVGLLLLYIFLYHPINHYLNVSARQTRAMMLVLPPDVVQVCESVQAFVKEHSDD